MSAGRVVVIEDEPAIRVGIAAALRNAGYEVDESADGEAGLAAARRVGVDLVLLDLMLPRLGGMEVLRALRKTHPSLPVIILTARGSEEERVTGLRAGADDYVVKPFSARELLARVEAVLRRSPERPSSVARIGVGDAVVDLQRREVACGRRRQTLSEMEWALLEHLAAHHARAISREELLSRVWGLSGAKIETRAIDMHVARLRAKLEDLSGIKGEECIVTVRRRGYMLGPAMKVGR